jgi:uncharacterized protein (DUF433 family)
MDLPGFLTADDDGQVHCTGHRIGLVDIVYYFNEGYSAEMIVGQFPTLPLALVYKVIGFYLENRQEVDGYVAREQQQVEQQRRTAGGGPSLNELRRRLAKMQPVGAS